VSTFDGAVSITATDCADNASTVVFTVARDATPLQVWVSAPPGVISGAFTVTWGAVDAQAGVAYYDLDVSVDGGPWQRVLTRTPITNYQYTNPPNTHVTFRVTATDHVSNAASAVARTSVVRVTKYYYHGGARVALRTTGAGGSVVYWLHSDHLGSVSLVTDHASRIIAQQRFLPYGGVRYSEGTFPTDVGFTGHRGHPALGLVYMRARYYHVALGRFVSADTVVPGAAEGSGGGLATVGYDERTRLTPLTVGFHETRFLDILNTENGELLQFGPPVLCDSRVRQEHTVPMGPANPQALNRYAYCLGNPVRYVDPTGHQVIYGVSRQQLAYFAAKLTTRATEIDRAAVAFGVGVGIIVQIPVAIVEAAACTGTLGWGCLATIAVGETVVGAAGYGAYQLGGGAKAAGLTDIANFISEVLADPAYADIERFDVYFLPPAGSSPRLGEDLVFFLVGYHADGTEVHISGSLSVSRGVASEASELLLKTLRR